MPVVVESIRSVKVPRICAYCGAAFLAYPSQLARGLGKYCRAACGHASLRKTPSDFWARVQRGEACWLWQGARNARGYGVVTVAQVHWLAHRYAYTVTYGPIPEGMQACHHCDNPPCIRPDHLFLGDDAVNRADMAAKGRGRTTPQRGATNSNAVLSSEQAVEIRRRYAAGGVSQRKLAAEYGVVQRSIAQVIHRRTWHHAEPPTPGGEP